MTREDERLISSIDILMGELTAALVLWLGVSLVTLIVVQLFIIAYRAYRSVY